MERSQKDKKKELKSNRQAPVADRLKFSSRLLLSVIVNLALAFTVLFFGPIELMASNIRDMQFNFSDMVVVVSIVSVAFVAISSLAVALFRGRLFSYMISLEVGALLCFYIQGNFLNPSLGLLTGDAIDWSLYRTDMVINLLVMGVILIIPLVIHCFNKKLWQNFVRYVPLALVVMQLVALITILPGVLGQEDSNKNVLTNEGMFEQSTEDNITVFVVDRLDYDYVNAILTSDATFFDDFDGFTHYTNATSEYAKTNPAIRFMLTNDDQAYTMPMKSYYEDVWAGDNLLAEMSGAGYDVRVYTHIKDMFGNGENASSYVDNIEPYQSKMNYKNLAVNVLTLSAYRYVPLVVKPTFWMSTDDVNRGVFAYSLPYVMDETLYDEGLQYSYMREGKAFKFYHFNGSHPPFVLDAGGNNIGERSGLVDQTMGCFNIIYRGLQQMKEMGTYDDATILILGDHGDVVNDYYPAEKATYIGLFYKPAGSAGTPIVQSKAPVSQKNIVATLAQAAGLPFEKYGRPLGDIGEDEEIERFYHLAVLDEDFKEDVLYTYSIVGEASNFDNWTIVGTKDIVYPAS